MDRRQTGQRAEDIAAEFLAAQGLQIVARNFRRKLGELDIVAKKDDVLIVAEVRTRASDAYGGAAASVDSWKQHCIARATMQFLKAHKAFARCRVRFDVVVVGDLHAARPRVEWIQHAFVAE